MDFSRQPTRGGFFQPSRFEGDVFDCDVVGELPTDLDGAFVRVGGEWFYPPLRPDDAAFNTDGCISLFRFKGGKVDYRARWIRTPRFVANRKAGRQLFGPYRNPFFDDPSVKGMDRTVANTAAVAHGGKLFALKEDALPYEIDPKTLETVGPWDFHGKYKSCTFTAHPKLDPATGEMICYGYEATGLLSNDVFVYTVDKAGAVTREVRFKAPYLSMMHDIALTEKYILFPFAGYVTSMEQLKAGKVHWGWDKDAPSYVGILPRDGDGDDVRWFKGPLRATIHTFNARDEGDKVVMEAGIYESNPFPFLPNVDGAPWDPAGGRCLIRRQTFDMGSNGDSFEDEVLFPGPASDLGKVDDRYLGQPYSKIFTMLCDPERPFDEARARTPRVRVNNCYASFDLAGGEITSLFGGDTHSLQECAFVPRSPSAPEGDGYLMGVASNYAEMRAELIVADAQTMTEIARVILPFRSSAALHGKWVGADEVSFD